MKNVSKTADDRAKCVKSDDDMVRRCPPLPIACGDNKAYLHLSRMLTCARSAGVCVRHAKSWLTPNEFQAISGRKAAKDWKRSIKHHGKSLKLLMSNGTLTVLPPVCKCETCIEQTPDAALEPASEEDEDDETLPLKRPPTDTNSRVCVADETSAVKNVVAPLVIRKKPGRKRKADAHESEPKRRKIKLPIEEPTSAEDDKKENEENDEVLSLKPLSDAKNRVSVADAIAAVRNIVAPLVIRKKPGRKRKIDMQKSEPKGRKVGTSAKEQKPSTKTFPIGRRETRNRNKSQVTTVANERGRRGRRSDAEATTDDKKGRGTILKRKKTHSAAGKHKLVGRKPGGVNKRPAASPRGADEQDLVTEVSATDLQRADVTSDADDVTSDVHTAVTSRADVTSPVHQGSENNDQVEDNNNSDVTASDLPPTGLDSSDTTTEVPKVDDAVVTQTVAPVVPLDVVDTGPRATETTADSGLDESSAETDPRVAASNADSEPTVNTDNTANGVAFSEADSVDTVDSKSVELNTVDDTTKEDLAQTASEGGCTEESDNDESAASVSSPAPRAIGCDMIANDDTHSIRKVDNGDSPASTADSVKTDIPEASLVTAHSSQQTDEGLQTNCETVGKEAERAEGNTETVTLSPKKKSRLLNIIRELKTHKKQLTQSIEQRKQMAPPSSVADRAPLLKARLTDCGGELRSVVGGQAVPSSRVTAIASRQPQPATTKHTKPVAAVIGQKWDNSAAATGGKSKSAVAAGGKSKSALATSFDFEKRLAPSPPSGAADLSGSCVLNVPRRQKANSTGPVGSGYLVPAAPTPGGYLVPATPTPVGSGFLVPAAPTPGVPGVYPAAPTPGVPGVYPAAPTPGMPGGYPAAPTPGPASRRSLPLYKAAALDLSVSRWPGGGPGAGLRPLPDSVAAWSADDVHRFVLTTPGCAHCAQVFRDHYVTGRMLRHLSATQMMNVLRIDQRAATAVRSRVAGMLSASHATKSADVVMAAHRRRVVTAPTVGVRK